MVVQMDLWSFREICGRSNGFAVVQHDLQSFSPNSHEKMRMDRNPKASGKLLEITAC